MAKEIKKNQMIVGNWKMNKTVSETQKFLADLVPMISNVKKTSVVLAPPFTSLAISRNLLAKSKIKLAAQNVYFEESGAYTGEISAGMIKELCDFVIVGHSERRHTFGERDIDISKKVAKAIAHKLSPVLCVGETHIERQNHEENTVVSDQLHSGLKDVSKNELKDVVIAYEPVWAIGTGIACDPAEAEKMAKKIRSVLASLYGAKDSESVNILYGGSVSSSNIESYLTLSDYSGALVGGASLRDDEFSKIVEIAEGII